MGFSSEDYFKNVNYKLSWRQEISKDEIEEVYKIIVENVKNARIAKGVSQLELTNRIGYKSVSTIAKTEAGLEKKHYNIEQLYRIADALGMPDIIPFFFGVEEAKMRAQKKLLEPKAETEGDAEKKSRKKTQ